MMPVKSVQDDFIGHSQRLRRGRQYGSHVPAVIARQGAASFVKTNLRPAPVLAPANPDRL